MEWVPLQWLLFCCTPDFGLWDCHPIRGTSLSRVKNRTCQKVLLRLCSGCLFTDMYDFCTPLPPFAQPCQNDASCVRNVVSRCFQLGPVWCARHRQKCQPATRNIDGNITGSPCQPWSRAGTKKGLEDPRSTGLWVWVAWVQTVKPLWAIHENVCGFARH